ncbi:LysR family transcriptional regulator [Ferrimonas futtsuensis]|uniref:LysR family transcriptional regulator n=1 Tax=Ferrimonas futtsuensis TaxID=364764 RepID=UPI0004206278|nr:LysR family transcriptional regulator [Ferrimonas futtsuensis]
MRHRFDQWLTFRTVAERGSFAAAAEALDLSRALISGHVRQLEEHYGVRLLHRTTRRLSLTDEGQRLLEQITPLLNDAERTDQQMADQATEIRGSLRIQVPAVLDAEPLHHCLAQMLLKHPSVRLEVLIGESVEDLVGRGIDLALQIGRLEDSSMVCRPLCQLDTKLVASPDYWRQAGVPTTIEQLAGHRCIHYRHCLTGRNWDFIDESGQPVLVKPQFVVETDSEAMALRLARSGVGITTALEFLCRSELNQGTLQAQMDQWLHPVPLSVVYPARENKPPRLERLLELLGSTFADPVIHR